MAVDSLSPIDGRYRAETEFLAPYFSEWALIRYRVQVELRWLEFMAARPDIPVVRPLSAGERAGIDDILSGFDTKEAEKVKAIERVTRHDVKAVEYYLKEQLAKTSLADVREFVHFFCTSEDINNLAYAQMLKGGVRD